MGNYSSFTATATSNLYEYGAWAQSQLPDTLTYAAEASNFGNNTTTGVYGSVDVNGEVSVGAPLAAALATGETSVPLCDPRGVVRDVVRVRDLGRALLKRDLHLLFVPLR